MQVNRSSGRRTSAASKKSTSSKQSAKTSSKARTVQQAARSKKAAPPSRPGRAQAARSGTGRAGGAAPHPAEVVDELVDDATTKLQELGQDLEKLRITVAERTTATDPFGIVGEIFAEEVRSLLGDALPDPAAARRAARLAVAEQAWEQRLGELWETRDVVAVLGVSKQRVSNLAKEHRLIVVPHEGRPRFPAWQFAGTETEDRACLAEAHRQLVEDGHVNPWSAASWFLTGHPDLDGRDPVDWIRDRGDRGRLLTAAGRDAARAAR